MPFKRSGRLARYSRRRLKVALIVVALSWSAYLLLNDEQGLLQVRQRQHELQSLEAQVTQLKAANDSLQQVLWLLENDLDYVEKVAREQYGMVKPGERVYRVRDKADAQKSGTD